MYRLVLSFLTLIILFFSGCGGGGSSGSSSSSAGAGGAGMKGPFVINSSVKAYKLDANGSRSSTFASTTTTDNLGHYRFSSLSWSGPTELVISGRYFNENTGSFSTTDANLSAIINITSGQSVNANINVLTDLEAQRIKALMASNTPLTTAKAQAKQAVVQLFDLNLSATTKLEDLDLTVGSGSLAKANAELLRISAAISAHPTVLSKLKEAIEDGNVTNDSNGSVAFATLAQAVKDVNLTQVANNLEQNLSISNPPDTNTTPPYASNTHPPVITSNGGTETATISVNENNSTVGTVIATDADGDTVTYSIVGGEDQSKFNINSNSGVLSFKNPPDFENPIDNGANNTYVVEVSANDGTLIDTQTITVIVSNTNDNAPVLTNIQDITKLEDSAPFTITLSATDADGETITNFSATSSDPSKATVSVTDSNLTITPIANANGIVDVNVTATDSGGLVDTQVFTLTLTPVNDAPILANSTGVVAENATAGTIVGQVTIVNTGDSPISSFSLTGVGASNFDINNTGYVTVAVGSSLDYESQAEYNLTVTANNGDISNAVSMDITVTDVADVVPTLSPSTIQVSEGAPSGTIIGSVSVSDTGDTPITAYTLVSGGDGKFSVANNGTITTTGTLDYETTPNYTLIVNATNSAGPSANVNIDINLTNEIDTPPILNPFTATVDENATITDVVGSIDINNSGDSPITSFTLSGSNHEDFNIDANGQITVAGGLNYESIALYTLNVIAHNSAGDSNIVDVNITINDVNEVPYANDANFTTPQDTSLNINLKPYVTDEDENQTITGSFSDPSHGTLTDNGEGNLTYTPNPGFTGTDSFTYTVTDNGTYPGPLSDSATVYITVTATNSPSNGKAVDPYIVGAQFWADVDEDGVQDTNEISTLSDENGSFSFQIFVPDDTNVTMIRQGLHNGKPFDGNISARFRANRNGIISPITSLESVGFSDSEIITLLVTNGMTASEFNTTITASELYLDPFDTSLLPLDGNMSGYSDAQIQKFRRVILANVAINNALTMQNGYGMSKTDMNTMFFNDPDGGGQALSPVGMMISAGKSSLTVEQLRNSSNARVHARIFVTIVNYMRDRIAASWGDTNNMMQAMQIESQKIPTIVNALTSAYGDALNYGLSDPKFGWVNATGTYAPMLFIQPNELGNHDVTIVYDDNGNDANVTFSASGHAFTNSDGVTGNWQVTDGNLTASDGGSNNFQFNLLGDEIKINGVQYNVKKVIYNGDDFSLSSNQSGNTFSGAANPGDFANFVVNGNKLDYNITGAVFGSKSGSLTLQDVTGHGIFFMSDIGNGNLVKIAKSTNLGIAVVPVNSTNTTMIMGLQVAQNDINESAIWNKQYIYAKMGEESNGSRYVDGYIMEVDHNHTVSLLDTDGNNEQGCWKTIGNHIVAKMDLNFCQTKGYTDINNTNADVRLVIRPPVASGRAGMIVDYVDGSAIGIGLEQKPILIGDMNGTFDAYRYKFDGSEEEFLQVKVTNNGTTASYVATPYDCTTIPCTLDTSEQHSGGIAINKLCDGTSYDDGTPLSGVMCVEHGGMGFIDVDEGYFMISNEDEMIFGSKHH